MQHDHEENNENFSARPTKLLGGDDHAAGGGHGGTEMGWLVSYADMMTLLFGLFVLLYSLKSDKTKDFDKVLEGVAKSFISSNTTPTEESTPPEVVEERQPSSIAENIASVKSEPVTEKPLKEEPTVQDIKSEAVSPEVVSQLENANKKLQTENLEQSKKIEKLISEIKNLRAQIEPDEKVIEDIKQENQDLKNQIEAFKREQKEGQSTNLNYLLVMIKWETLQHDLDLEIRDPENKKFNFKKRKVVGSPGNLEIDTQFGPGIELWKAENYKPGIYEARVALFNKNGNNDPAKVYLQILSQSSSKKSSDFVIKEVNQPQIFKFQIDNAGRIELLP